MQFDHNHYTGLNRLLCRLEVVQYQDGFQDHHSRSLFNNYINTVNLKFPKNIYTYYLEVLHLYQLYLYLHHYSMRLRQHYNPHFQQLQ